MLKDILLIIGAYLVGSVPTGLLLARAFGGVDIRTTGSGNIGATNVYRTLGKKVGIMTLAGDCLKGVIPVVIAKQLGLPVEWVAAVGAAAFLGHVYTIFLGFKGGKGVATALGVFLAMAPLAVLCALAVFIAVLLKWRYVSLASISAAAAMPVGIILLGSPLPVVAMTLLIAVLVIYKHRENIDRLRSGTESKFKS
ncbi:glycerol-3-phosphate 1-O-acyltransferase PlsY [Geobacter sp. AOG1]|uniref:glycerol-3-phosphate 1-O-acyltransferase PlsY n=1 Tax=Geobacter sp. AOG1 TaxID=1566346 RepID=UPI001CC49500|nr:glycerol-3-phosphate 1-O-acyltransferase PlsY [Geobacter sp. AOG1]GFE56185.1 glycerol-3-phosphate acyltransferase [Geobacter sp. AOG1]